MELFRKGKTHFILKFHRTDLVIKVILGREKAHLIFEAIHKAGKY